MTNQCASCQAENRDTAKFCDNCGAPLGTGEVQQATPAEQSRINWGAILIVLVIITGLGWVLFGPSGNGAQQPGGDMTNPHAGVDMGGDAGGMGGANPHGGGGQLDMDDLMSNLADAKTKLAEDPLDTDSLIVLYQAYGTIGRAGEVKANLDEAVELLIEQQGEMSDDALYDKLNRIAYSTLFGGVPDDGIAALDRFIEAVPERLEAMAIKGNIYYDTQEADKSISAYSKYLAAATPDVAGVRYWNVKSDRATMYLQKGMDEADDSLTRMAVDEFTEISRDNPGFWSGWFNLGLAQTAIDDAAAAEAAFSQARDIAEGEEQVYRTEVELARLRGEEPPAPPASMGGMGMGGMGGGASPHGGMGETGGGMANPHGGTAADDSAGDA